jgi:DUF4097 and DUF4098 domain-containing protein YvlB
VILGLVTFSAVMFACQWDFTKLGTKPYNTNTYQITEDFHNLSIDTDTADIVFAMSTDGSCSVVCYEEENLHHSVSVEKDTLVIQSIDQRSWKDHIGINFGSSKITLYLPQAQYLSLAIRESTGQVEIPEAFQFRDVDIHVSTGNIELFSSVSGNLKLHTTTGNIHAKNLSAGSLELSASTGKLLMEHVIVSGSLCAKTDTGDIRLDACDAETLQIQTDTGDITGTLLSPKIFIANSDTGSVHVPQTTTGGRCEITTDTGTIKLTIE